MIGMGKLNLPYLAVEPKRRGVLFYYVRRAGRRIRLPSPDDPTFMECYRAALEETTKPRKRPAKAQAGSLGWLILLYRESQTFARLADSTRAARGRILDGIRERAGAASIASVTQSEIVRGRDKRIAPEAANAFLKTISALFSWAVEHGHAKSNPVLGVRRIRNQTGGHHTWTDQEIAAFRARHTLGTRARTLMEIMLGTGLRISDAAILGRQHVRDGEITIRTKKTGVTVTLPILPDLRIALDAVPAGQMLFVQTQAGQAFSIKSAGQWFRSRCDEANVPGSAHGLRKAAATRLADAGASEHQLMAVFGWKDPKEAAIYTREANRKRLAASALALISGQSGNGNASHDRPGSASRENQKGKSNG
jgi:integrase